MPFIRRFLHMNNLVKQVGNTNIASTTAKKQSQFDKQIQKVVEEILDYPEMDTPAE
jgi:hypothetical protein